MPYSVSQTNLPGVLILEPETFEDHRGWFFESFNARDFEKAVGSKQGFVQDNHSRSNAGVIRGIHFQVRRPQDKLVRVVSGEVFDVAVDIRIDSPTFGNWFGLFLSAENKRQLWIPEGFAHGFLVTSDHADVLYKVTDYYSPDAERCLNWNDSDVGIRWPINQSPILSRKDKQGLSLIDIRNAAERAN